MRPLTVLITNIQLEDRSGTEVVVRDLALGLKAGGHTPVVYTARMGALAEELLARTVPVVNDLSRVGVVPDVIHGHHTAETIQALLRFPGTPAVFVCHDWSAWHDAAPLTPLVRQYLAVDDACRDRLVCRDGVPPDRVRVLGNAVDLSRIPTRPPLPAVPRRALVFSNTVNEQNVFPAIAEGCRRAGVTLDRLGVPHRVPDPENHLVNYDVVFARGRSALEGMACGAAVVLADIYGFGGLVTRGRAEHLRRLNFGRRAMVDTPVTAERVEDALRRFDPTDAAAVTAYIREVAALDPWLDQLINIYREVSATPATAAERESLFRLASDAVDITLPHTRRGQERWTELDRERATAEHLRRAGEAAEQRSRELSTAADERCREQAAEHARQEAMSRAELGLLRADAVRQSTHVGSLRQEVSRLTDALQQEVERLTTEHSRHVCTLRAEIERLRADAAHRGTDSRRVLTECHQQLDGVRTEVAELRRSFAVRAAERVRRLPLVGWLVHLLRPRR